MQPSMKKELRNVQIQLCKRTGEGYKATYSSSARKSSYCNHVVALLYEIAWYSVNQVTEVPRKNPTQVFSENREVSGNEEVVKESVMRTTLISSDQKKGKPPTLYDPRLNFSQIKNVPSILKLNFKIDRNIGFVHVVPDTPVFDKNLLTKYCLQLLGSPP